MQPEPSMKTLSPFTLQESVDVILIARLTYMYIYCNTVGIQKRYKTAPQAGSRQGPAYEAPKVSICNKMLCSTYKSHKRGPFAQMQGLLLALSAAPLARRSPVFVSTLSERGVHLMYLKLYKARNTHSQT